MTQRPPTVAAAAIAAVVLVCGCGASTNSPASRALPDRTTARSASDRFVLATNGPQFTLTMPAPATDPTVASIDDYRQEAGASGSFTYALLGVDNTQGRTAEEQPRVTVVVDGRQYSLKPASDIVGDWFLEQTDTAVYNDGVDLDNKLMDQEDTVPGATTEQVYILTGPGIDVRPERAFVNDLPMELRN